MSDGGARWPRTAAAVSLTAALLGTAAPALAHEGSSPAQDHHQPQAAQLPALDRAYQADPDRYPVPAGWLPFASNATVAYQWLPTEPDGTYDWSAVAGVDLTVLLAVLYDPDRSNITVAEAWEALRVAADLPGLWEAAEHFCTLRMRWDGQALPPFTERVWDQALAGGGDRAPAGAADRFVDAFYTNARPVGGWDTYNARFMTGTGVDRSATQATRGAAWDQAMRDRRGTQPPAASDAVGVYGRADPPLLSMLTHARPGSPPTVGRHGVCPPGLIRFWMAAQIRHNQVDLAAVTAAAAGADGGTWQQYYVDPVATYDDTTPEDRALAAAGSEFAGSGYAGGAYEGTTAAISDRWAAYPDTGEAGSRAQRCPLTPASELVSDRSADPAAVYQQLPAINRAWHQTLVEDPLLFAALAWRAGCGPGGEGLVPEANRRATAAWSEAMGALAEGRMPPTDVPLTLADPRVDLAQRDVGPPALRWMLRGDLGAFDPLEAVYTAAAGLLFGMAIWFGGVAADFVTWVFYLIPLQAGAEAVGTVADRLRETFAVTGGLFRVMVLVLAAWTAWQMISKGSAARAVREILLSLVMVVVLAAVSATGVPWLVRFATNTVTAAVSYTAAALVSAGSDCSLYYAHADFDDSAVAAAISGLGAQKFDCAADEDRVPDTLTAAGVAVYPVVAGTTCLHPAVRTAADVGLQSTYGTTFTSAVTDHPLLCSVRHVVKETLVVEPSNRNNYQATYLTHSSPPLAGSLSGPACAQTADAAAFDPGPTAASSNSGRLAERLESVSETLGCDMDVPLVMRHVNHMSPTRVLEAGLALFTSLVGWAMLAAVMAASLVGQVGFLIGVAALPALVLLAVLPGRSRYFVWRWLMFLVRSLVTVFVTAAALVVAFYLMQITNALASATPGTAWTAWFVRVVYLVVLVVLLWKAWKAIPAANRQWAAQRVQAGREALEARTGAPAERTGPAGWAAAKEAKLSAAPGGLDAVRAGVRQAAGSAVAGSAVAQKAKATGVGRVASALRPGTAKAGDFPRLERIGAFRKQWNKAIYSRPGVLAPPEKVKAARAEAVVSLLKRRPAASDGPPDADGPPTSGGPRPGGPPPGSGGAGPALAVSRHRLRQAHANLMRRTAKAAALKRAAGAITPTDRAAITSDPPRFVDLATRTAETGDTLAAAHTGQQLARAVEDGHVPADQAAQALLANPQNGYGEQRGSIAQAVVTSPTGTPDLRSRVAASERLDTLLTVVDPHVRDTQQSAAQADAAARVGELEAAGTPLDQADRPLAEEWATSPDPARRRWAVEHADTETLLTAERFARIRQGDPDVAVRTAVTAATGHVAAADANHDTAASVAAAQEAANRADLSWQKAAEHHNPRTAAAVASHNAAPLAALETLTRREDTPPQTAAAVMRRAVGGGYTTLTDDESDTLRDSVWLSATALAEPLPDRPADTRLRNEVAADYASAVTHGTAGWDEAVEVLAEDGVDRQLRDRVYSSLVTNGTVRDPRRTGGDVLRAVADHRVRDHPDSDDGGGDEGLVWVAEQEDTPLDVLASVAERGGQASRRVAANPQVRAGSPLWERLATGPDRDTARQAMRRAAPAQVAQFVAAEHGSTQTRAAAVEVLSDAAYEGGQRDTVGWGEALTAVGDRVVSADDAETVTAVTEQLGGLAAASVPAEVVSAARSVVERIAADGKDAGSVTRAREVLARWDRTPEPPEASAAKPSVPPTEPEPPAAQEPPPPSEPAPPAEPRPAPEPPPQPEPARSAPPPEQEPSTPPPDQGPPPLDASTTDPAPLEEPRPVTTETPPTRRPTTPQTRRPQTLPARRPQTPNPITPTPAKSTPPVTTDPPTSTAPAPDDPPTPTPSEAPAPEPAAPEPPEPSAPPAEPRPPTSAALTGEPEPAPAEPRPGPQLTPPVTTSPPTSPDAPDDSDDDRT